MVQRIDSPKAPVAGPGPKTAAPPAPKPAEQPMVCKDGVTLSRPAEGPVLGASLQVEGGKIRSATTVKIDADPEQVMAAIEGDWSKWWPKGEVGPVPAGTSLPKPAENESRFLFKPGGERGAAYVVRQGMPVAEQAGRGQLMMVVPTKLSGDAVGEGRFEIRITPDNKTLLTAKWDGVAAPKVKDAEAFAKAHQALEKAALENLGPWLQKQQN